MKQLRTIQTVRAGHLFQLAEAAKAEGDQHCRKFYPVFTHTRACLIIVRFGDKHNVSTIDCKRDLQSITSALGQCLN